MLEALVGYALSVTDIDSDYLCYIYLASYPSSEDLSLEGQYYVP